MKQIATYDIYCTVPFYSVHHFRAGTALALCAVALLSGGCAIITMASCTSLCQTYCTQASVTLYQDDHLSWLSSPEHHVEYQLFHPERHQLEVASLGIELAGLTSQEYGVQPEVANQVAAYLGLWDLALDAFSSGTSAHLRVCEKYWSAQDSAMKKHWAPHQGLMGFHYPRVDIPRTVAKIRKHRCKAVLASP